MVNSYNKQSLDYTDRSVSGLPVEHGATNQYRSRMNLGCQGNTLKALLKLSWLYDTY